VELNPKFVAKSADRLNVYYYLYPWLYFVLFKTKLQLWGETERIFDILRMKTGFNRNAAGSNHSQKVANINTLLPDNKEFILTIPQKEFDSNPALDATTDQNPM